MAIMVDFFVAWIGGLVLSWFKWFGGRLVFVVLTLLVTLSLSGCQSISYFYQAAQGHLEILHKARPISLVVADQGTSERLKAQLSAVQRIREFSVTTLGLPDNGSYRSYADLGRRFVVWNVVAAPVDSLKLQRWCFPVTGCISYRGYYSKEAAEEFADGLRNQGLDVAVMGVPAYSTLGFTDDPVLNTFVYLPEGKLARMLFHELAHQLIYVKDDTQFNESFASAVEELGVQQYLDRAGFERIKANYLEFDQRRAQFRALLAQARADLDLIYGGLTQQADTEAVKEALKTAVVQEKALRIQKLQNDYAALRVSWGGWSGYDLFMSTELNNAKLAVGGLYEGDVPAFKQLFIENGQNYVAWYSAVSELAKQDNDRRRVTLDELGRRFESKGARLQTQ